MNEQKFKTLMRAADSVGGDYASGYHKGLRRHYHGEKFGTPEEHEKYMAMDGHRQEMGDGYRDGFAGLPPRGVHGNTGNSNALAGDEPATSWLQVRVTPEAKAAYVKAAQAEGVKLSAWVLAACDERLDRDV
jgi:hypothetical protein